MVRYKYLFVVLLTAIGIGVPQISVGGPQESSMYADLLSKASQAEQVGNHDLAAKYQESALQLVDSLGWSKKATAEARTILLIGLAENYPARTRYEDALQTFRMALNAADIVGYKTGLILSLIGLAKLQYRLGQFNESLRSYERSLPLLKEHKGPADNFTLSAMHDTALLYFITGHPQEAERLLRQAIESIEEKEGRTSTQLVKYLDTLAMFYNQTDREALAVQLWKRIAELRSGTTRSGGGTRTRLVKGNDEQAYKNALDNARRAHDPNQIANALSPLANFYMQAGRDRESEDLYREALAIRERHNGQAHPLVGQTLVSLGILCLGSGRYDEAEKHLRRAVSIFKNLFAEDHPHTIRALMPLSGVFSKQGRLQEAIALIETSDTHRQ